MTKCAVFGLGEAGAIYASALVGAGHEVAGYDPVAPETPAGVTRAATTVDACEDAEVVLVFTSASVAPSVAKACLPHLHRGATYADFTTSAPSTMKALGESFDPVSFADVAILGPVATLGVRTPLMVSGPGATTVAQLLTSIGSSVEVLEGPPGNAMAHKLLRSVLMKGFASVVVEAVEAGRAAGMESWIRDQIASQLAGDGQSVIDRFLTGTAKHAARRAQEMRDAGSYLSALQVPAEMTLASADALARIAGSPSV